MNPFPSLVGFWLRTFGAQPPSESVFFLGGGGSVYVYFIRRSFFKQ